jgi:hypothetical protein
MCRSTVYILILSAFPAFSIRFSRHRTTIDWEVFLSLLAENKGEPCELEAFVTGGPLAGLEGGHGCAAAVAKAVWDATDYRFKCVISIPRRL